MESLKGKKINFLGDSITEGTGASDIAKSYVKVFARISGADVYNNSIGGTKFARQYKPSSCSAFDRFFSSRVKDMRDEADYVVVFGGTNDFGCGDAPFGKFGDKTVDTFYGGLYDLFTKLYEKYPYAKIVTVTPLHRVSEDSTVNEAGLKCKPLREYVKAIREVAELFSVPVLDLFSNSNMITRVDVINKKYFADGLHPNDLGHKKIAETLYDFLLKL